MQRGQSIDINQRFFAALDRLVSDGRLRGRKSFATIYGLNWGNLYRLQKEPQREFQLAFLAYLVSDFGISADWLLTGRGDMFGSTSKTTIL